MAEDARISRIELLYGLCTDIRTASGSLCDTLSFMSQSVWSWQSRLESLLSILQDKVNVCEEELDYARREYEYYCSDISSEDYSPAYAGQLRAAMGEASRRLDEAREDCSEGTRLVSEGVQILNRINALSSAAVVSISSAGDRVAMAVENAAFHLHGYKV